MTQVAKKKEDTRSVKLIKTQSNQVQQLLAEKEALGKQLGEQQEKTLTEREQLQEEISYVNRLVLLVHICTCCLSSFRKYLICKYNLCKDKHINLYFILFK